MDYNQEQFFHAQFDVPKMPFYMSYPMQNLYLTEMEYEKDMDRMKRLAGLWSVWKTNVTEWNTRAA